MNIGRFTLMVLAAAMVAATGCKREVAGCMDTAALNHNPKATLDDGSCRYVADEWAGSYEAHDTLAIADPDTGLVQAHFLTNVLVVEAIAPYYVTIEAIGGCTVSGRVTLGLFERQGTACPFDEFHCTRVGGDTLRYGYTQGAGMVETLRSTAVRR